MLVSLFHLQYYIAINILYISGGMFERCFFFRSITTGAIRIFLFAKIIYKLSIFRLSSLCILCFLRLRSLHLYLVISVRRGDLFCFIKTYYFLIHGMCWYRGKKKNFVYYWQQGIIIYRGRQGHTKLNTKQKSTKIVFEQELRYSTNTLRNYVNFRWLNSNSIYRDNFKVLITRLGYIRLVTCLEL